jgi:hypothetical protein
MLLNVIKPYEDEILYSVLARYIALYGTIGPKQLLPNLFDKTTVSATLDLPSGISALSRSLVLDGLRPFEIIMNHTLYPLYNRFISNNKKELVIKSMYDKSGYIHTRMGLNASSIESVIIPRYCPQCYREDLRSKNQESYFRRVHQIPAINICIKHNLKLHSLDSFHSRYNKHEFISINEVNIREDRIENRNMELLHLSRKVVELFNNSKTCDYNNEPYFYNEKIKKIGFSKGQKSINIEKLYSEFTSYYNRDTLKAVESKVSITDQSCWLKLAVRKRRRDFNPVRHMLLLNFIQQFEKSSNFYASPVKKTCRNPVCPDYNSNRKTNIFYKTDFKTRREITHIVCSCGYHYTESYNHNKNIINRSVREFGELWRESLKHLLSEKLPIREIARKLHCDSKSVLSQSKTTCNLKKPSRLLLKRQEWIQHQNNFPEKTISLLRKSRPDLYAYIYRKDKKWLLSLKYINHENNKKKYGCVNWEERDKEWATILETKLRELKNTDFENRISKSLLLKLLEHETTFRKNKDKLPLCCSFIERNEESLHNFRKRRILREAHEAMTRSSILIKWKLIRKAGIRKEHLNEELEMLISSLIENSNQSVSLLLAS